MIGLGRLIAALFRPRDPRDGYREGYEMADRIICVNRGKPGERKAIEKLLEEAYFRGKRADEFSKQRATGIYAALEDNGKTYKKRE